MLNTKYQYLTPFSDEGDSPPTAADHFLNSLPWGDEEVAKAVKKFHGEMIIDSVGNCRIYSGIAFKTEADLTFFLLRWTK